uniref:Putative secreted protein n=1 Tax=Ixodes ricinus TaxID=34613 RepID=A0A6B0UW14_IXORI
MMIFSRWPASLSCCSFLQSTVCQSPSGGHSGMKTKSASLARAATMARYPQCLPITSRMKVLWWLEAVVTMASMASMMRCNAESVPMVMSVPQKSLSIDPTMPTMFRWAHWLLSSGVMVPLSTNSSSSELHSWRKRLAPVSEPSPPITTKLVMP